MSEFVLLANEYKRPFLLALKGLSPVLRFGTLFGDYAATREVTAQLARGAQILGGREP